MNPYGQTDFELYLDTQIKLEMTLAATGDKNKLTGLRNIKSDLIYTRSKFRDLVEVEIIKKLYKQREETAEIYIGKNEELRRQELLEMRFIKPFLPKEIGKEEIFAFLDEKGLEKNKNNFKSIQSECEKYFEQKVESKYILEWIG